MSNTCAIDGAEINDNGSLCWDDTKLLEAHLREASFIVAQLTDLAYPTTSAKSVVGLGGKAMKSKPPIRDFDALDRANEIRQLTLAWAAELARHINAVDDLRRFAVMGAANVWLADHAARFRMQDPELTKNAYHELTTAIERGRGLVEVRQRGPVQAIGRCDTYIHDATDPNSVQLVVCSGIIYVEEAAATADCRLCGATYDAFATKVRSLRQIEDHLYTADVIVTMFGSSMPLTVKAIGRWKASRKLSVMGAVTIRGQVRDLLRLGDVIDLWLAQYAPRK